MKIYITALHLNHGGVEMAITSIANALVKRDYPVCLLVTYNFGTTAYTLDSRIEVQYLTSYKPNKEEVKESLHQKRPIQFIKEGIKAFRILRKKKHTMIKAISSIEEGVIISTRNEHTVLLSKYGQPNVKKIAHLHHDHRFDRKMCNDFKYHYTNIDYFLLLTDELTNEVKAMMAQHNQKTQCLTMPNFLPQNECAQDVNTKKIAQSKQKQFVAVGRLSHEKGFDRLLDIWKLCAKKYPDWKLKLIGGGELESALEQQIKKLGLEKQVVLTGMIPHNLVLEEMSKSKGYLMTSHTEGFPLVLIEAMQQGCPVVAYDVRVGPRAIITDYEDGFLIEDGNKIQFVQCVLELIENQLRAELMGEHAQLKAKKFNENNIMKKWLELIEVGE